MSTILEPTDIDTLKADLASLEQRLAALRAERAAPALRTDSARRAALDFELQDMAILIADAKVEVIEAECDELSKQYAPLIEARQQAQIDAQHALDVLIPAAKQAQLDAQQALYAGQGAYQRANNNMDSLRRQVEAKQQQIATIRAGKG